MRRLSILLPALICLLAVSCGTRRDDGIVFRYVDGLRYPLQGLPDSLLNDSEKILVRQLDFIEKTMVEVTDDGFTVLAAKRPYFRENGIPMAFYRSLKEKYRANNRTIAGMDARMRKNLRLKETVAREREEYLADPEAPRRKLDSNWAVLHHRELLYDEADRRKASQN